MRPVRFQIKMFRRINFHDTLSGLLTSSEKVYFYAHDVGEFLQTKKPIEWASKNSDGLYGDIYPDPIRHFIPLISLDSLKRVLKGTRKDGKIRHLWHILRGSGLLHYEGVVMGEHILKTCPCTFTRGISFLEWANTEMNRLPCAPPNLSEPAVEPENQCDTTTMPEESAPAETWNSPANTWPEQSALAETCNLPATTWAEQSAPAETWKPSVTTWPVEYATTWKPCTTTETWEPSTTTWPVESTIETRELCTTTWESSHDLESDTRVYTNLQPAVPYNFPFDKLFNILRGTELSYLNPPDTPLFH